MKKKACYFLFMLPVILFMSCSKTLQEINTDHSNDCTCVVKSSSMFSDNYVTLDDVEKVLKRESEIEKAFDISECEIKTYKGEAGGQLFIVNISGHGWRIYSSDKRVPAIVAEGGKGYFSIEEGSPSVSLWLEITANRMLGINHLPNESLSFNSDEINQHQAFWSGEEILVGFVHDPIFGSGHWEETIISSDVEECSSVDHLTAHWDQNAPYNECCPYYLDGSSRSVAGCVAIAGSQVLLYLHNTIGVPSQMYSQGLCVGNINNYQQAFAAPNSTVWDAMEYEYVPFSSTTLPEAILIGAVGQYVGMHYCDNILGQYSWAFPSDLKSDVFEPLGLTGTNSSYDETIVANSIEQNMPVIVWASDLLIPVDGNIHCFVIDGYLKTRIKYTHYHHFVYDDITALQDPTILDYWTYTYSRTSLSKIKINWGWWTQWAENPVNDGWYSLTQGWTVENGGTFEYDHYVNMFYGFSPIAD